MIKDSLIEILKTETGIEDINLETPENESFGDYSTNVALVIAKKESQKPREYAQKLVTKLQKSEKLIKFIEKIEIAGPGFINFWLKKDILIDNLIDIDSSKDKYGSSSIGKNKVVIIDYSSPNIAKPFGIGHLRSTIIGQAIYNLYKFLGYEVIGDNHLGDWGTQFGKLLYMLEALSEEKIGSLTISDLESLYVEFHKKAEDNPELEEEARIWFKKLEDGDEKAKKLWELCVDISLSEFERIYKMLNVKIDFAFGESYYQAEMQDLLSNTSVLKHVTQGEEGARVIDLSSQGIETPLMLLKKDEGTTYATRDLATIAFRARKWDPDKIIYEVGAEQSFYFKQVFAAAKLLGLVKKNVELVHTAHGLYLAEDGKKFATRKGKTIKLEEVLAEAVNRAVKLGNGNKETAEIVGIGAIKYFDLMHSVKSDVIFDWEKMMNLQGNSGPYLQYTVARINSLLLKSKGNCEINKDCDPNSEEKTILRTLIKFPEIVQYCAFNYSPNYLCSYLYDLAQKYNGFYNKHKVIGGNDENFKLLLSSSVGIVLNNGLKLLGIIVPERM